MKPQWYLFTKAEYMGTPRVCMSGTHGDFVFLHFELLYKTWDMNVQMMQPVHSRKR